VVLRARQVLGRIEANSHVAVGLQTGYRGRVGEAGGTAGLSPDQPGKAGGTESPVGVDWLKVAD
jgi:hypothetical protein